MDPAAPPPPPSATQQQTQFPCRQCGANLNYAPGTTALKCPYCGAENQIAVSGESVQEIDFRRQLHELQQNEPTQEQLSVRCQACAAETSLPPNTTASTCPFCGAAIVATAASRKSLRPKSLLPFHITQDQAIGCFRTWVNGLWFAPNELKRCAERCAIRGAYLPAWTYDSDTDSWYTGERGDDYWETETYTEEENGHTVTKTRQVQKTRWSYVSGRVLNRFDDVLIMATGSLPEYMLNRLQPWDLKDLVPYEDAFLSGFTAESYQVGLADGFEKAKGVMDGTIRQSVCRDIGGDHQRINSLRTSYANITFKHLLLPVWISAYLYREKTYRFLVNARTGHVHGERPYSVWKILLLVLTILAAIAAVLLIARSR